MRKNQKGFVHLVIPLAVVLVAAVLAVGVYVWHARANAATTKANTSKVSQKPSGLGAATAAKVQVATPAATTSAAASAAGSKTAGTSKAPSASAAPAPVSVPSTGVTVDPNSCLPSDASSYAKEDIGMSNSAYLATNSYTETTKFRNALDFAGLLGTIDAKKTVVFAPNDYEFDTSLSAAQLAFMNASPANMRSVLGWQIITSCVVWAHNMDGVKSTITLNTLNGPVTYTPTGDGAINGVSIAIWDWFTSNGAVHIMAGFVAPPKS